MRFDELEEEASEALEDIVDREGLRRGIIELKAEHLLDLSVGAAVLEPPEEAHDPSQRVEFEDLNECDCDASHNDDDEDVNGDGEL